MNPSHEDHLLVIDRCHPDGEHPPDAPPDTSVCWDPEWDVLHPPSCNALMDLTNDDWQSPGYDCGLSMDMGNRGDDVFDLVAAVPYRQGEPGPGIGDLLPAGRYLCRWYFEVGTWDWEHTERDDRSGIEIVPGPVWDGDREGWR